MPLPSDALRPAERRSPADAAAEPAAVHDEGAPAEDEANDSRIGPLSPSNAIASDAAPLRPSKGDGKASPRAKSIELPSSLGMRKRLLPGEEGCCWGWW